MSRLGVVLETGLNDLENAITSFAAAIPATEWDAEKDDKLLSRMAHGTSNKRKQAFDAFYRRHATYLYGICYNLANRYRFGFFSEEDVFQSTMAKARDHADTFNPNGLTDAQELEDAVDAWLGGIATHVVFDLIRRIPKCVCLDPEVLGEDEETEDAFSQTNEAVACDDTEDMKLMREAIETLSPREKEVIWAMSQFYVRREHQRTPIEDLDEIVEHLGISKTNFRKIKQRARTKILQYMVNRKLKLTPEAK